MDHARRAAARRAFPMVAAAAPRALRRCCSSPAGVSPLLLQPRGRFAVAAPAPRAFRRCCSSPAGVTPLLPQPRGRYAAAASAPRAFRVVAAAARDAQGGAMRAASCPSRARTAPICDAGEAFWLPTRAKLLRHVARATGNRRPTPDLQESCAPNGRGPHPGTTQENAGRPAASPPNRAPAQPAPAHNSCVVSRTYPKRRRAPDPQKSGPPNGREPHAPSSGVHIGGAFRDMPGTRHPESAWYGDGPPLCTAGEPQSACHGNDPPLCTPGAHRAEPVRPAGTRRSATRGRGRARPRACSRR
jgi:hypothetical protein